MTYNWKPSEAAKEKVRDLARQAAREDGWMQPSYSKARGVAFTDFTEAEQDGWQGTTQFQAGWDPKIIEVADEEEIRITGKSAERGEDWLQSLYLDLRDVFWEEWIEAVGIYEGWRKAQELGEVQARGRACPVSRRRCMNEDECDYEGPKETFDWGQLGGMPGMGACPKCGSIETEPVPPGEENFMDWDEDGKERS